MSDLHDRYQAGPISRRAAAAQSRAALLRSSASPPQVDARAAAGFAFCPYCGLPTPSGSPQLGACVGHRDLPPLDPSRFLPDVLAAQVGYVLDVPAPRMKEAL